MSLVFTTGRAHGIDSIKNSQGNIMNKYVAGAGVGASNIAVRRAKYTRAAVFHTPVSTVLPLGTGFLDTVATYLRNYMSEFRNSNFYGYRLDGDNKYISDGGNDMYDGGNFVTPWLLSGTRYDLGDSSISAYPYAISYDMISETTVDTDFKYISLGYIPFTGTQDTTFHPLTVIGYRQDGPVGWQIGGNAGADGGGNTIYGYLYNNTTVNGFNVYAGYNQIYNAGDPTICNFIILLGHSSWKSVFGPITMISGNTTQNTQFLMYSGAGSKNIVAIYVLLSKPDDGTPIPNPELETIVFNYTKRISEAVL